MKDWYDIDFIEGYINRTLDEPTLALATQKVAKEPSYAQTILLHTTLLKAVRIHHTQELRELLQKQTAKLEEVNFFEDTHAKIHQETSPAELKNLLSGVEGKLEQEGFFESVHQSIEEDTPIPKKTVPIRKLSNWWLAAASIIVILGFGLSWYFSPGPDLFAQHFEPYPDQISEELHLQLGGTGFSSGELESLRQLQQAMGAYNSQSYSFAIGLFEQYLLTSTTEWEKEVVQFYLAMAYLDNKEAPKAQALLLVLSSRQNFELQTASQWFLALSYIKTNDKGKAIPLLKSLEKDAIYAPKAKQLLKELQ